MFYDVDGFLDWVAECRKVGIDVPIIPGIMPITSWTTLLRRTRLMHTQIPPYWLEMLEPIKDDDAAVRDLGTKLVAGLCRRLLENGILQLHFYTMNLEKATFMILDELAITTAMNLKNPLPWRQVHPRPVAQLMVNSAWPTAAKKKTFARYSGRIATRVILPVPKNGTNFLTVAGATPAPPPMANLTSTASASHAPPPKRTSGGVSLAPSEKSAPSSSNTLTVASSTCRGVTPPSVLKSIPSVHASSVSIFAGF